MNDQGMEDGLVELDLLLHLAIIVIETDRQDSPRTVTSRV
jgi:hypothetical protein